MKKKRTLMLSVVICVALIGLLPLKEDRASAQPIKIGALLSLTGPFVDPGKDFRAAIEVRLEEVGCMARESASASRPRKLL